MERKNVSLPDGLADKAHKHGLNVSRVCAVAVEVAVKRFEPNETGVHAAKQNSPAGDSIKEAT